jgi:hypothetical protein
MATSARRIDNEGAVVRQVSRPTWSPAQIVATIGGIFLIVLGGVGLAHTGFKFTGTAYTRTIVMGLPVTSLGALVELLAGLVVLSGAAGPSAARATSSFIGVLGIAWGLIVALDPTAFGRLWGYNRNDGVFWIIVGFVLLVAAAASPIFMSRHNSVRVSESRVERTADPVDQLPPY